ncbi:MAG: peptide-binding protein [Elusimicrobiota bacterium]
MKAGIIKGVLFVLLFLSGCSSSRERIEGGAIIRASIGDATYLNPLLSSDSASSDINNLVFNGLVKYDKNLELTGDLAEKWEISDGGRKIIFYLREDVRWHDGEEFSAKDVLYTYEMLVDENTLTPHSSRFELIDNIYAPDEHTVVVEYAQPLAPALQSWGMGIIPEHIYRDTDINTNPHNRNPVGTGPYTFSSWKTDDRIILNANPDYFEGSPEIGRVIYRIIPDTSVQFMELEKGTVDWMKPTPEQWVRETSKKEFSDRFNRFRYPAFSFTYMGYNLEHELFKDRKVREAISYAVNKKDIIDAAVRGLGSAATGPYPPVSWAYNPDIKDHGYDIDRALELLQEAGWKINPDTGILEKEGREFSFTIMTNEGNSMRRMSAEIIQQQLSEIGMEVDVRIQEWSSFVHQYVNPRRFEAIIMGWSLAVDPDQHSLWHSSQTGEHQYNFCSYKNSEVDRLLEEGRRIFDIDRRKDIYRQVHRHLHRDQPYLFLYFADSRVVIHNRFKNIRLEKAGIGHNFIDWYVPKELQKY